MSKCVSFGFFLFTLEMVRISSYNCKSFKRNVGGVSKLCDNSDIVFLQEHWLFPSDLPLLNNAHKDFMSYGISSIDPSDSLIMGRPYGGVGVLWNSKLASLVRPMSFHDDRIIGLEFSDDNQKVLLLGVYLPYDTKRNFDQYAYYLAKLKSIIDDYDSPHVCILGDFNADIVKRSDFGQELKSFCYDMKLMIADVLLLPSSSITHVNDGSGTESWLDHIVCTNGFHSLLSGVGIDLSIASSDHFPIFLDLQFKPTNDCAHEAPGRGSRWVVDWSSVSDSDIDAFENAVERELSDIAVPYEVLHCSLDSCHMHDDKICMFYDQIIQCVTTASRSTIAKKRRDVPKRVIPGWSEFVEQRHRLLGDIYSLWALVGKPRQGYIHSQLCLARSQFKYAVRFCLKNEKDLRAKALADKFASNPRSMATF